MFNFAAFTYFNIDKTVMHFLLPFKETVHHEHLSVYFFNTLSVDLLRIPAFWMFR